MTTASGLPLQKERVLALLPKFPSSISILCSSFIIYEVFCDHKTKGTTAVQRALVGMSTVDILASSAWFMSTWAVPKESGWAFAAGNRTTCNYQGFLLQLAVGAPLYNSSLALFYLLMIKMRWTDDRLARIEKWVHGLILSFTVGTSILLLYLDQYNQIGAVCWVIGDPADCGNSSFQPGDVPCERGNYAWAWGVALFYGPLWVCVLACCISMVMLYLEVRKTHRKSEQYSQGIGMQHSMNRSGRDSARVATQAILYSASFIITWMPSTLWSIAHWFNWSHYGLDVAAAAAEPLQGFWNMIIFLKSRPQSTLKVRRALSFVCPCVGSPPDDYEPRTSFASGLRSRLSRSNISGQFTSSCRLTEETNNNDGAGQEGVKKTHRNTASTEVFEDVKSPDHSIHRLVCDSSDESIDNGDSNKPDESSRPQKFAPQSQPNMVGEEPRGAEEGVSAVRKAGHVTFLDTTVEFPPMEGVVNELTSQAEEIDESSRNISACAPLIFVHETDPGSFDGGQKNTDENARESDSRIFSV